MDPDFMRMTEDRFNHEDAFKGMTGVTNQYKKFIAAQIHNGCDNQKEQEHYVSFNSLCVDKTKPNEILKLKFRWTKSNSGLVSFDLSTVDLSTTVMTFADLIDFNQTHVTKKTKTVQMHINL